MTFSSSRVGSQKNDIPAEASESVPLERITLVVSSVRTFIKDSGFFVFTGTPTPGAQVPRILVNGRPYFGKTFTVKGVSPTFGEHRREGQEIDCFGHWVDDPKFGMQFDATYVNERMPTSPEAIEAYLGSGRVKGIGPAIAKAMVKKWGVEVLSILDNDPDRLLEIKGMTPKKVETAAVAWKAKRAVYEIVAFLGMHEIGEALATRVYEHFKALHKNAIDEIQRDPYLLVNVDGIGFKKADAVAVSLGLAADSPVRLRAALRNQLDVRTENEGHTAIAIDDWMKNSAIDLGLSVEDIKPVCQELINSHEVVLRPLTVTRAVYQYGKQVPVTTEEWCASPFRAAESEVKIARHIARLIQTKPDIDPEKLQIISDELHSPRRAMDASQIAGAWSALTNPISVLTGGPGTGKTTTLRNIVDIAIKLGWSPVLAAPTGRAAKRMEDAIGEESMTMHRRLEYRPGMGFQVNESHPLGGDLFILDETSMVGTSMARAWLAAIPNGSRVLLVGDEDQLSSVEIGDVLHDFMASKVLPVARLTHIHRTKEGSSIAVNAARVRQGQPPEAGGDPWLDDYAFIPAATNEEIVARVNELVDGLLRQGVPPNDIQMLVPQKPGEVGTYMWNETLRWRLNPMAPDPTTLDEVPFCMNGDRLMQKKNNYDLDVFNGDIGIVENLDEDGAFTWVLEDGRRLEMNATHLKDMELAFAQTVHKSQGSEKPIVIMPLSASHKFPLNRNLFYTGITRARSKLLLVGSMDVARYAANKIEQKLRITGLRQELLKLCPVWDDRHNIKMPSSSPSAMEQKMAVNDAQDSIAASLNDDGWDNDDAWPEATIQPAETGRTKRFQR